MKRIFAVLMAAMLMLSLVACGGNTGTTTEPTSTIASPVEILNTVWATYAEDEKFPAAGGDMTEENMNMEGPGVYGLADTEALDATLGFPAASVSKIDSAASLMHMMNANTFTCGAYHLVNAADKDTVVSELKTNITGRQWMCGFPDKLVIVAVEDYLVSYFGNGEIVDNFTAKLTTSYTQATVVCEESLVS
ncbi:MAG: bacteriocin transport accessory protein [Ruminococcus sp.]|nr:bacteriocin transport accessory protein [Ruminococcus sp.]